MKFTFYIHKEIRKPRIQFKRPYKGMRYKFIAIDLFNIFIMLELS